MTKRTWDPKMVQLWHQAAHQGDAYAQYRLGVLYQFAQDIPQDFAEAARWYRAAADQGNAGAQYSLGTLYELGVLYEHSQELPDDLLDAARLRRIAVDQDAEAVKWYRKAADQGNADAQYRLGLMYARGGGVPQNHVEAVTWYRKAADQGNADAQFNLGLMSDEGQGIPQDYAEAAKWYQKAAEQEHTKAQSTLALMYKEGRGVKRDHVEAVRWYSRTAEQGNIASCFRLALMYKNGDGVVQDYPEAVRWYHKAAEQGNALAQFYLGDMYENCQGVEQDYQEAARWYSEAADEKLAAAQFRLGHLCENGQGVPQDYVRAYMLFNFAAVSNYRDLARGTAAYRRDCVAAKLTPEQIKDAQRLISEVNERERTRKRQPIFGTKPRPSPPKYLRHTSSRRWKISGSSMNRYLAIILISVAALAAYGLNRGIYVGSERYVGGYSCCPDSDFIQKRCRYLFVTGISEIDANDGLILAPRARSDPSAFAAAAAKPDNGYCRLFGD